MSRVVARVDHIVLESGDEEALFAFFTETLGLPIAWPMDDWGFIHEGGVNVGNCSIGCNHKLDPNAPDAPRIAAVAFEPAGTLETALAAMDGLGLEHSAVMASGTIDNSHEPWNTGWRNALILHPRPVSFLCEYAHDVEARRRAQQDAFEAASNPLGITGIEGVWCNTTDIRAWGPLQPREGPWVACDDSVGAGVDLDEWWGLYIRVESLSRAVEGLHDVEARLADLSLDFIEFVDRPVWEK